MPQVLQPFYTLHSRLCSLVVDCRAQVPEILYWGARLATATDAAMLALLATRQEAQACMPKEAPIALSPELGAGFQGNAGIQVHRDGRQWATRTQIESAQQTGASELVVISRCAATDIKVAHKLVLDYQSDVLAATTELTNTGDSRLWVEQCNAPTIPLPAHYDKILGFAGRWAMEFQRQPVDLFMGSYLRENRSGRTSHDAFPGVIVHPRDTSEASGPAYGLHLGWSGNHRVRVEQQFVGRAYAQMGELLFPGELCLGTNQSYCSPVLYAASTENGLSALSQCFHGYVAAHLTDERIVGRARPVHFNTWEATYFDLSEEKLHRLVDAAAQIGVERFVLDDGWFKNRRSERAGLGDWWVDKTLFAEGLAPLAEHLLAKGMEFGLWLEPEMVNPDSDLYRAHPDWVLHANPAPVLLARNQLVLDLSRPEVQDYLFQRVDTLLAEYPITYLKWDMNRTISQPGDYLGRAAGHRQTLALYQLMARIRSAHPRVEIESCASGGGRADFGILAYSDRIWVSDSNDALDRLRIQNGFSVFFPARLMGAHVGPRDCHATGRNLSMAMRAGVALFGHMGIEANLLTMDVAEKTELTAAVALHKQHRELIHQGDLVRLDSARHENAFGVIARDRKTALFSYALLDSPRTSAPGRLRMRGLDADARYRIECIWPLQPWGYSRSILDVIDSAIITGDALENAGLQLPIMHPQSLLIFYISAV